MRGFSSGARWIDRIAAGVAEEAIQAAAMMARPMGGGRAGATAADRHCHCSGAWMGVSRSEKHS